MLNEPNRFKDFPLPYTKIDGNEQSFSADWFKQYPRLHYDQNAVFCLHIL